MLDRLGARDARRGLRGGFSDSSQILTTKLAVQQYRTQTHAPWNGRPQRPITSRVSEFPRTFRALARALGEEHRTFAARLSDLASREGIAPVATEESRRIRAGDEALLAALRATGPEAFDEAWLRTATAGQERFRELLDTVLVPAARNEVYRAALLEIRPRVAAHREELARSLTPAP